MVNCNLSDGVEVMDLERALLCNDQSICAIYFCKGFKTKILAEIRDDLFYGCRVLFKIDAYIEDDSSIFHK